MTLPVGDALPGEGVHTNFQNAAGGREVCISAPFPFLGGRDFHSFAVE